MTDFVISLCITICKFLSAIINLSIGRVLYTFLPTSLLTYTMEEWLLKLVYNESQMSVCCVLGAVSVPREREIKHGVQSAGAYNPGPVESSGFSEHISHYLQFHYCTILVIKTILSHTELKRTHLQFLRTLTPIVPLKGKGMMCVFKIETQKHVFLFTPEFYNYFLLQAIIHNFLFCSSCDTIPHFAGVHIIHSWLNLDLTLSADL